MEREIFGKAIDRIDEHIVLKDRYSTKINSGREIFMSEGLFDYCIQLMQITNEKIVNKEVTVYCGKIYINNILDEKMLNVPKLKSGLEPSGYSNWKFTWYGTVSYISNNKLRDLAAVSFGVAGLTGAASLKCFESVVGAELGAVLGVVAFFAGVNSGTYAILQQYYPNGIMVHTTYLGGGWFDDATDNLQMCAEGPL